MTPETKQLIEQQAKDLDKINNQRRMWLYASSVVVLGIVSLIFTWDWLDHFHSSQLWWLIISVMLVISANWWYWTMRVIRILLKHQKAEYDLLKCIIEDIGQAKDDIRFLADQYVDKRK